MLKKNILMMTLLSSFLVTVNAQEANKPSPVTVAKTAFGATLPAANSVQSNPQVNSNHQQPVQPNPVTNAAATATNLNTATQPNGNIPPEQVQEVPEIVGIDENTRLNNEAIRNLFNVFATAINSDNNAKLMSVKKEHAIIIGSNQELVSGKKTVADNFAKTIGTNYKFERSGFSIEPGAIVDISLAGDTAKVYGRGTEKYKLDSLEHTVSTRWSATVTKEGEQWKISSFHSGVNFVDNSVLTAFEEFGWKIGVSAGLIGLLIGFILALGVSSLVKRK